MSRIFFNKWHNFMMKLGEWELQMAQQEHAREIAHKYKVRANRLVFKALLKDFAWASYGVAKELDNYTEHAIGYATRTRSKRTWKKASRAMNRAVSKAYQSGKALAKGFFQNLPLF